MIYTTGLQVLDKIINEVEIAELRSLSVMLWRIALYFKRTVRQVITTIIGLKLIKLLEYQRQTMLLNQCGLAGEMI